MESFKIGDQVELIPGNYDEESNNPTKTRGVITRILGGDYCYYVSWDNGGTNAYRKYELKSYLMPDIKGKVGDHIQVLNTAGAIWLASGHTYIIEDIDRPNGKIKIGGYFWSCQNSDYLIVSSQAGESPFDKEILESQRRRIAKENALQKAAKHYPAGTKFKSMGNSDVYTIADKPEYSWSENTEGIYAWAANNLDVLLRVYICKRDDWAEIIYKDLLGEAKEKFPPGTRFINIYGTTSQVADDPQYSLASSNVYAKCISGKSVTICKSGKWVDIVVGPPTVTSTPQISSFSRYAHGFNVGDVVEVIRGTMFFDVGHVSTIAQINGDSLEMRNHRDENWWISAHRVKPHTIPTMMDLPKLSSKELKTLEELLFSQTKTNTNGTESNKSVKLQGTNLQIREGNLSRGVGLKSSRSKIKLGSNYSYN